RHHEWFAGAILGKRPCLLHRRVRANRDGRSTHRLLNGLACAALRRSNREESQDHAVVADDHTPARALDYTVQDLLNALVQMTGWHLGKGKIGSGDLVRPALSWKPAGKPVGLAARVAHYFVETQALEPRRGSRAQVSLVVRAVHDDRPIPGQLLRISPLDR